MGSKGSGNIVSFPNLKRRVIEKATILMEEKRYHEALPLFRQAVELEEDDHELLIGLIMCLFEIGELKEAVKHCKRMLHEGIGDYYHILQIYMMILVQAGAYDEGYETLLAVIQEQKLPAEHAEHFYKLFEFFKARANKEEDAGALEDESWHAFQQASVHEQMEMIRLMNGANMKRYEAFCRNVLKEEMLHPIVKTLMAKWLLAAEMNITADVIKFNRKMKVNLPYLQSVVHHPFIQEVEGTMEQHMSQSNPALWQVAQELWHRHLFMLFPFLPEPSNVMVWAGAVHYTAMDMQGLHPSIPFIIDLYEADEQELNAAIEKIKEIEEFSSI